MSRLSFSSLEPLEVRIAPAAVFTYMESDGDTVKVTSSKGSTADLTIAAAAHVIGGHLTLLDLATGLGTKFSGASITIAISAFGDAGDGLADVGAINAANLSLGKVLVKGDLGQITAGASATKTGVASLTVNSLGAKGVTTGATSLESVITGSLGGLKVFGDVDTAHLSVTGKLGSATIGGDLVGGAADNSGSLTVTGPAGGIKVGGRLIGGAGKFSGSLILSTTQKSGAVFVAGDVLGSGGDDSASISGSSLASVFVGGTLGGGTGQRAGSITVDKVGALTVSGDIVGGDNLRAGSVLVKTTGGLLQVGGSIFGASGTFSGSVASNGSIAGVSVKGSLYGSDQTASGSVVVKNAVTVFIGGSVNGGTTSRGAGVLAVAGLTKTITVGGSLVGGSSQDSGSLNFVFTNKLTIGGSVSGTVANSAGSIFGSVVGSVEIGGDVSNVGIGFGSSDTPATTIQVAKSVHVGGSVFGSYIEFGTKTRSDLSAGSVQVDGNWASSDLLVGSINLGADDSEGGTNGDADNISFGDIHDTFAPHDTALIPTIKSISIGGTITGDNSGVHYGFVAGKIGSFIAGSTPVLLGKLAGDDLRTIGADSVSIHEVGGTVAVANPTFGALKGAATSFFDTDGDLVKVTASKGTAAHLNSALHFTNGKLDTVNLGQYGTEFSGANLSFTVAQLGATGNGVIHLGFLDATGIALGKVVIAGDLEKIVAGVSATKPGVASLTVNSFGLQNTGALDLASTITGNLGALKVLGDISVAQITITGKLGSATIGGDLDGGGSTNAGSLTVNGAAGAIKFGGNIFGAGADFSGSLNLNGASAGAITVGGGVYGGGGAGSGSITAGKTAALTIGGPVLAGAAASSGSVSVGAIGNLTVGGNIIGGATTGAGVVVSTGTAKVVTVGGSIIGNGGSGGFLQIVGKSKSVTVQGTLLGGSVNSSGSLLLGDSGSVFIGGSIFGNGMNGGVYGANLSKVTVNGSLLSSTGSASEAVRVVSAGSIKVLGSAGNGGNAAGNVIATSSLGSLDISGKVTGVTFLIGGTDSKPGGTVAKTVHIGGAVSSSVFAFGGFARSDVKVGTFTVDSDWTNSDLAVGLVNLGTDDAPGGAGTGADNANFGDAHDALAGTSGSATIPSIASIIVEGAITGTATGGDHFGFVAAQIGAFRTGSHQLTLQKKAGNDSVDLSTTGDVTVKELSIV